MKTKLALASLALLVQPSLAQVCPVAIDFNKTADGDPFDVSGSTEGPTHAESRSLVSANGKWFFSANNVVSGIELYSTDGTRAGTQRLGDIFQFGDSNPSNLTVVGNRVYFAATEVSFSEMWSSQGSPGDTQRVAEGTFQDPFPLSDAIGLGNLWLGGSQTLTSESGLWLIEPGGSELLPIGSLAGLGQVSSAEELALNSTGSKVFYRAESVSTGAELWVTDGTVPGTTMVLDINPGSASSAPKNMVAFQGLVYFSANDGVNGEELWSSDGTAAGTSMVLDINVGSAGSVPDLTFWAAHNGELYFSANDGTAGYELWKTDGTSLGTQLAGDVNPGLLASNPTNMVAHGGELFFFGDNGTGLGRELIKLDAGGSFSVVKDILPGAGGGAGMDPQVDDLISVAGKLCFQANDGVNGNELWVSDGTLAGTQLLVDSNPGIASGHPGWLTVGPGSTLMFVADGGGGRNLWSVDLNGGPAVVLSDPLASEFTAVSDAKIVGALSSQRLLATGNDGIHGMELATWEPVGGLTLLQDLRPGAEGSNPTDFGTFMIGGQQLSFFVANPTGTQEVVMVTDHTPTGAIELMNIGQEPAWAPALKFVQFEDRVYFAATTAQTGLELWGSDGTAAGTSLIADIAPGSADGVRGTLTPFKDHLYFVAGNGGQLPSLWRTDGTAGGTTQFSPGHMSPAHSDLGTIEMYVFKGRLYYGAFFVGPFSGYVSLMATDGTVQGTGPVSGDGGVLGSVVVVANPRSFFEANGRLMMEADAGDSPSSLSLNRLVSYSGKGTDMRSISYETHVTAEFSAEVGNTTYFASNGNFGNTALRLTDGTLLGTELIMGESVSSPSFIATEFISTGNGIYFTVHSTLYGRELWYSEGTGASTALVCDLFPGPGPENPYLPPANGFGILKGSSNPKDLYFADGKLFFTATDGQIGRELFYLDAPGPYSSTLGAGTSGMTLSTTAPVAGSTLTINCRNAPFGALNFLAVSGPVSAPSSLLAMAGHASWLDLATVELVAVIQGWKWSISVNLPAGPGLAGLQLNAQNYAILGSFPAETSNGVALVF